MNAYISVPNPITPQWLTSILQQSGTLQQGEVLSIEQQTSGAFNSHTSHLSLSYTADVPPGMPTRFVLKQNIATDWGKEAGRDEVKFYQFVNALHDHPPIIIPCYAAAYDKQQGDSYLLLQDLSATHQPPITREQQMYIVEGVPTQAYIEAVIDCLAQLHAYWWNHALIAADTFDVGYWSRNAERFEQYLQRRRTSWERLIAEEQSWFPTELRILYEQVFEHLPSFWQRYLQPRFRAQKHLTLTHGDAYFANFLCPRNPDTLATSPTYLLDWQSPNFDIGAYDLANLCATFWTSQQRHEDQREERILRQYHHVLSEHGVSDYSWEQLMTDYQAALICWLLVPVQDNFGGSSKEYWWPKMQCLVAAFREWHCQDLLGL